MEFCKSFSRTGERDDLLSVMGRTRRSVGRAVKPRGQRPARLQNPQRAARWARGLTAWATPRAFTQPDARPVGHAV